METRTTVRNEFDKEEMTVRYEIENGDYVGTVEWQGPGQVTFEMPDGPQKEWFQRYFDTEDSVMGGAGEPQGMTHEKRNESEAAFNRAAWELSAYSYKVRQGDGMRAGAHPNGNK
jgi:hypothetical protein